MNQKKSYGRGIYLVIEWAICKLSIMWLNQTFPLIIGLNRQFYWKISKTYFNFGLEWRTLFLRYHHDGLVNVL